MIERNSTKTIVDFFVSVACLISGQALAQQSAGQATREATLREIQQVAKILSDALMRRDASAIGQIYADGYVHIDQYGTRIGKQERLAEIGSGQRRYLAPLPPGEDTQYEVHGDVVVVTSKLAPAVPQQTFNDQPVAVRPTFATRVWLKRDGRWQVVLTQVTPITER